MMSLEASLGYKFKLYRCEHACPEHGRSSDEMRPEPIEALIPAPPIFPSFEHDIAYPQ
jgi:hypothetical protein